MTTNALGKLCGIEVEAADVVSYLMIGLACSRTCSFYLNQTCHTYPLGINASQVVKNRYTSSGDAIASAFRCDVYTKGCRLLTSQLDLFVETFLITLNRNYIIITTLND